MQRYREISVKEIKEYFYPRPVFMTATPDEQKGGAIQTYVIQPGQMEGSVSIELPTSLQVDEHNILINPTRNLNHGVSSKPLTLNPFNPEASYYNIYLLMGHLREVTLRHPTAVGKKKWRFFLGDLHDATDARIALSCCNSTHAWLNANISRPLFEESADLQIMLQERVVLSPCEYIDYCYVRLNGKLLQEVRQEFEQFYNGHDEAQL